jgi:hypothetical protein
MLSSDETRDESGIRRISEWLATIILTNGHEMISKSMKEVERQERLLQPNLYQVPNGPSIESAIHFSTSNTFTKYVKPLADNQQFISFEEFNEFYQFPSPETLLSIPLSESMFTGTTFAIDQVNQATSCILFTSPRHLWAMHELISSPSHDLLTVFSMDGMFSLRLLHSGSHCDNVTWFYRSQCT